MRTETDDYTIDIGADRTTITGVLRLHSPKAYADLFEGVYAALDASTDGYTIDVSGVKFLNSSGITGLSRLVLTARKEGKAVTLVGAKSVPWQGKTLTSLQRLYDGLTIELV